MSSLMHFGRPKRSGRYKWGSGLDPFHHGADAPGGRRGNRIAKKLARKAEKEKKRFERLEEKRQNRESASNHHIGRSSDNKQATQNPRKMTDDELTQAINRLTLEKRYRDLHNELYSNPKKKSEVKRVMAEAFKTSAKDVATDVFRYGMATAVNKATGKNIAEPKKKKK